MNIPADIQTRARVQLSQAAGLVMVMGLIAGCSPSTPPPATVARTNSLAGGKTNTISGGQGTNFALLETNSVFDAKLKNGRDPFFPTSSRQETKPPSGGATAPVVAVLRAPVELALVLNGIMGTDTRRAALINDRTFETGEELVVHTTNGPARVRCMAISPLSVTITVDGKPEPRKLVLKK